MRRACQFVLLGIVTVLVSGGARAQVSFYTAVDLALRNSTQVRISAADVQHAEAAVMESVDAYKPSFSVGSSLGYSYGFPVGQPSIYSVIAQFAGLLLFPTGLHPLRPRSAAGGATSTERYPAASHPGRGPRLHRADHGEPADDRTRSGDRLRSKTGGDRN